jgi:glycyl-radical enzyme activating protein
MNETQQLTGRIFEIQRFSVHDGPGIRTTVFMKGCTLRCLWCHNPEGIDSGNVLSFLPDRCIGCGYCFRTCKRNAHKMHGDHHVLDREACAVCGSCTEECYSRALELVGRDVTVADVLKEVLRDKPFYETSGGGMTLSGGEPLMQAEFSAELLHAAKLAGLHCAIETCGHVTQEKFMRIMADVDLFLYDIKDTNPARHHELTGATNEQVLDNLRFLHDAGAAVLVRLPIIPGLNDLEDHFQGIAGLATRLPKLLGFEIMPYHPLGTSKHFRFGTKDALGAIASPTPTMINTWVGALRGLGVNIVNV